MTKRIEHVPYKYKQFRASGKSGFLTISLFADMHLYVRGFTPEMEEAAPFWLNENRKGDSRLVLREKFLELEDPTGYEVSMFFFGCYDQWEAMLQNCRWFRRSVDEWKEELAIKLKARALRKIAEISQSESSQAFQAAKFLAKEEYKEKPKAGRPSKTQIQGELTKAVELAQADNEDLQRILEASKNGPSGRAIN